MTAEGLPAATKPDHVALSVSDLGQMIQFYQEIIGLTTLDREDGRALLGAGGDPLVEIREEPDTPPRPDSAAGLFHIALRVPSRRELGDILDRVREQWELDGASDHHVSEALYLSDPDGNGIEVYRDRNPRQWPTRENGRLAMDTFPLDLGEIAAAASGKTDVPPDTELGHVHLECSSVSASQSFYVDILGLGIRQKTDDALFLAAGEYHHRVGLNNWQDCTSRATGQGLAWCEFAVPDRDAIAAARERLTQAGVSTTPLSDGFAVADPDGIQLRLRSGDKTTQTVSADRDM